MVKLYKGNKGAIKDNVFKNSYLVHFHLHITAFRQFCKKNVETLSKMCILFGFINNDASEDEFSLVLASNRDESYKRPTAPASRWKENCHCISGKWLKIAFQLL